MRRLLSGVLAFMLCLGLFSGLGGVALAADGITLSDSTLNLAVDETATLTATTVPANTDVTWSSDQPGFATVDENGKVTAVAIGVATITAKINVGDPPGADYTATCTVTVQDPEVKLSQDTLEIQAGESLTLKATTVPKNENVTWISGNDKIATVVNGKVTAISQGDTFVNAVITGIGYSKTATCTVKVTAGDPKLKASTTIEAGKSETLKVENLPKDHSVTWSSNDPAVATVSSAGVVSAKIKGTATIYATINDAGGTPLPNPLTCKVTVTDKSTSTARTISYSTDSNTSIEFDRRDFNDACKDALGTTLDYVRFTDLPQSSRGSLQYDYYGYGGHTVRTTDRYHYNPGRTENDLSEVSFVPAKNYNGTVSFNYTGYDVNWRSFTGTVSIKVGTGSSNSGDLSYSVKVNNTLDFSGSDFNNFCKDETRSTLDYVEFTQPNSSRGTLYYKYDKTGQEKVTSGERFYRSRSPYIDDVTFVPAKDYTGTVSISFTGRSIDNDRITGSVSVKVGTSSSDSLSYSIKKNETLNFKVNDFNTFCKDETGYNLDYIIFTLPVSTRGTLYSDYGGKNEAKVTALKSYYRSKSPYIDDLSFVPAKDYTGTVSISFTGRSTDNDRISGTISIKVGTTAADSSVKYSAKVNENITFKESDFNTYCKDETGSNLDYVKFTLPNATRGTLYHDYGSKNEEKVTSSKSYYRSSNPLLSKVTFVPASGYTGTTTIDFTGKSTGGKTFSGTVTLTFGSVTTPSAISYSTSGGPVTFKDNDFISACTSSGAGTLASVQFTLPSATQGTLYYGYKSDAAYHIPVSQYTDYSPGSGLTSISQISFVPAAGYTGNVSIKYTGKSTTGVEFTGTVSISVSGKQAETPFTDMGNHGWATEAVNYMYKNGIVTGTTDSTFAPGDNITRGDFMLMLYRAFDLKATNTGGFSDVPADSYYAEAIATAKALGIAMGDQNGNFNPKAALTREDAMVLIYRTMEVTGQSLTPPTDNVLSGFIDGYKVSSYAREAVSTLVSLKYVEGDGKGNLNPQNSISRAEMSQVLYKVLTW